METPSNLVIKVKYGDMLRRFNSPIVDGELKLSVDALRKKIISLFNLDTDADLVITYIDEDGDVVTLVDDDDIRDVVKQALNPLRITVKSCSEKSSTQDTCSVGSSTSSRSPRVKPSVQNTDTGISVLLRNLPEPIKEMLVKISFELASKASASSSSAPGGAELVDYYLKLGLSYLDNHFESRPGVQPITDALESKGSGLIKDGLVNTNGNRDVAKLLKDLPEPIQEMITRFNASWASLASSVFSSTPGGTDLEDYYKKLGLFYMEQCLIPRLEAQSSTSSGVIPGSDAAVVTKDSELLKDDQATTLKALSNLRSELSSKNNECLDKLKPGTSRENDDVNIPSITRGNADNTPFDFNAEAALLDSRNMNVVQPGDNLTLLNPAPAPARPKLGVPGTAGKGKAKKVFECYPSADSQLPSPCMPSVEKVDGSCITPSGITSVVNSNATGNVVDLNESELESGHSNVGPSDPKSGDHANVGGSWPVLNEFGTTPVSMWATSPKNKSPFTGMAVGNVLAAPPLPASVPVPFSRSIRQNDSCRNIFHNGVRCDGCGIHPIGGPRFKSKVKVDYDLCGICFAAMGNGSDYIRMDFPMAYRSHLPFKGFTGPQARNRRTNSPQIYRGCKVKSIAAKLDSRFVLDVNVLDGTVMPPSTPFTKIWRMKNSGTLGWPPGTHLVWIGGDKLSNALSVELEIPASTVLPNCEVDVAVDFISPDLPGRYISYWRMSMPSGQKFGQRVWVLIQVDNSTNEDPLENIRNLNLNLPPVSSSLGPEIINVNPEPTSVYNRAKPEKSKKVEELVQPNTDPALKFTPVSPSIGPEIINVNLEPTGVYNQAKPDNLKKVQELVQPNTDPELKFPINDSLLVGNGVSSSTGPSVSYPIIDLSDVPSLLYPLPAPTAPVVSQVEAEGVDGVKSKMVEEQLLRELEEMGFKQLDLNKEVLRMNEYDFEQAVADLCGVTEWDLMLEELEEMGFNDRETNRKLLMKNNGSIKRVVMDLIANEMN